MVKSILKVGGMSCQHCVKAITGALKALAGVSNVAVDLAAKTVTVEYDPVESPLDRIRLEIEDQGYEVMA